MGVPVCFHKNRSTLTPEEGDHRRLSEGAVKVEGCEVAYDPVILLGHNGPDLGGGVTRLNGGLLHKHGGGGGATR